MAYNDWDPDELLDFDYGKRDPERSVGKQVTRSETPSENADSDDFYKQLKQYEALRANDPPGPPQEVEEDIPPVLSKAREAAGKAKASGSSVLLAGRKKAAKKKAAAAVKKKRQADKSAGRNDAPAMTDSQKEIAALKEAQREAYERYRSTYSKNYQKKKRRRNQASIFNKGLSVIYLLALAVFAGSLTLMDVLPTGILAAVYIILALLSIIIVTPLRRDNIRSWVRRLASLASIILIAFFGIGTAYALGTLSFLNFTSVDNDNKVASITKEPFNVCITGIDVRGKIDEEGRSDVNMVVTVNPETQQILMTSIPRDYQIYMPDKNYAMDKLTHTGFYSVETTIGAEEDLLDTKINYYVKVNFSTVEKFIDAIGGIDVYSEYSFNPVKMKSWTVQEGMNHMNGKQALAFARERKAFPTGDNQRIKNQQAVFEAMIDKATSSSTMLLSYNKVMASLKDYFRMSISSSEFRSLIKLQLAKHPEWKIIKNTLSGGDGSMGTYTTGYAAAYVMTQDQTSIENARSYIKAMLNGDRLKQNKKGEISIVSKEEGE